MASETDLIELMRSRAKVWTPTDLCNALGVHVIEAIGLIEKARKRGVDIRVVSGEKTGNAGKVFLGGHYE